MPPSGVVDIPSRAVVKSAKVGEQPEGVKITPDGKLVYVTSEETGTISVLDPVAGKRIYRERLRWDMSHSVAFYPMARKASMPRTTVLSLLVDAVKMKMIQAISLGKPGQIKPMAVLLSPDATETVAGRP